MLSNLFETLPQVLDEGFPAPMGALARDGGVNVAVFSEHATAMELCVFDAAGRTEMRRWRLHGPHDGVWHAFLPGVGPGLVYGFRAHGPWAPEQGHRFNPRKLLLDPWAREIVGRFEWRPEHLERGPDGGPDRRDNSAFALKARVAEPRGVAPGWRNAPRHAERDLVIYEVQVKSFSMLHPDIPHALRGTYAALAHPAALAHFKRLGVTALELLPVHYHLDEAFLGPKGLSNHWGYNTLGFFCADPRFAQDRSDPTAVHDEFRAMVATLHAHGIEVLLDVVYNHTAEADERGPTISFRGLDQASWYRLDAHGHCLNWTGCGNTLNVAHPRVTQFVLDSLRFWAEEMGVDGFRFDLAPVLGRTHRDFDPRAPFFTALAQDPVLSHVRLIAEAWDSGPHGYQVGRFPARWLEWNDRFRDSARRYWLGHHLDRGEFARRFAASNDLFHHGHRKPTSSVNFIAAHDGFTLADFTGYARKHNQANGENNQDGRGDEICAPLGPEGPSADPAVLARRGRFRRALMGTLLLAQGTPMINAGDELLNSQQGNNNAWNQDNPTGWLDWPRADHGFAEVVARLLALRREEPALRHGRWFLEAPADREEPVMRWTAPDGRALSPAEWHDPAPQPLACRIDASLGGQPAAGSRALFIAFNPQPQPQRFTLPDRGAAPWRVALDTSGDLPAGQVADGTVVIGAHALVVLRDTGEGAP